MAIDVTVFINNLVANNPNVSANVKKGVSAATAVFSAAQGGGVNVSNLLNSDALPANVKANINAFNNGVSSLQSGSLPSINGISINSIAAKQSIAASSKNLGPDQAQKETFSKGANRSLLEEADAPIGVPLVKVNDDIPILLQNEIRALMIQIAYMESNWDTTFNSSPYLGRYAVHNKTLETYGYKKNGAFVGKDGIKTEIDFVFDNKVQDRIMERFLKDQYRALIKAGAIRAGDSKQTVAGLLAVSYQFQDATPTSAASLTALAGGLTDMISGASSALTGGTTGIGQSGSILDSSAVLNAAGTTLQGQTNNPTVNSSINTMVSSLKGASGTDATAAAAVVGVLKIQADIKKTNASGTNLTTNSTTDALSATKQSQLSSVFTNAADASKLTAAKVNVTSLQAGASDLLSALPANKVKEWRLDGKAKDSRGRPGSLFFNAGRYAVQTLASDKG
jgi:hypothetical protein